MKHPLTHCFKQMDILPSYQSDNGARVEGNDFGCGSVKTLEQFIRKELEKEMRLNTSHATAETEAGMVVTRSKQRHTLGALRQW